VSSGPSTPEGPPTYQPVSELLFSRSPVAVVSGHLLRHGSATTLVSEHLFRISSWEFAVERLVQPRKTLGESTQGERGGMLAYGSVVEVEGDTNSSQTGRQLRKKIVPHQQHGLAQVPDSLPFYESRIPVFPPIPSRDVAVNQSI